MYTMYLNVPMYLNIFLYKITRKILYKKKVYCYLKKLSIFLF